MPLRRSREGEFAQGLPVAYVRRGRRHTRVHLRARAPILRGMKLVATFTSLVFLACNGLVAPERLDSNVLRTDDAGAHAPTGDVSADSGADPSVDAGPTGDAGALDTEADQCDVNDDCAWGADEARRYCLSSTDDPFGPRVCREQRRTLGQTCGADAPNHEYCESGLSCTRTLQPQDVWQWVCRSPR